MITGSGFGASPTVDAGTAIAVSYNSRGDTSIDANFAISSTAAGGNQSVVVTTTSGTQLPSVNFYVQIPKKLIRDTGYGTNGLGSLVTISNGNVLDIYGNVVLKNECGVYRNVGYFLVDQETPAQTIQGDHTLVEHFTNYSTDVPGNTVPPDEKNPISFNQTLLGDIQFIGYKAPSCLGTNDHESFDQHLTVQIDSSHSYGLSMVNHIDRGYYSGTATVNVTITTP